MPISVLYAGQGSVTLESEESVTPASCPSIAGTAGRQLAGWTNWPPICTVSPVASGTPPAGSGTTDINSFYYIEQLWHATRERASIISGSSYAYWPPESTSWGDGTISSIVQQSNTRIRIYDTAVSGGNPGTSGWIDSQGGRKWFNAQTFNGADAPWMPVRFKIVLDKLNGYDPSAVTVYNILDNGTNWVEIEDDGTVALNRTLSSYVGKKYAIHGLSCTYERPVWSERWPQRPNDPPERDWGEISIYASGVIYDNTQVSTDEFPLGKKNWTANAWAGKDLIALAGTKWTRYNIVSNTRNTVTISPVPGVGQSVPSHEYWIVDHNAFWRPSNALRLERFIDKNGRWNLWRRQDTAPWAPYEWYRGLTRGYWSHDPSTGGVRAASVIDTDISLIEGEVGDLCEEIYHNDIRDNLDFHISNTDECNECPDGWINPWSYQTLRGIQVSLENMAGYFVERKNYTGGKAIPGLTPATMFRNMNTNYRQGTIQNVVIHPAPCIASGVDPDTFVVTCTEYGPVPDPTVTVTWNGVLPKDPLYCHWTILDDADEDVVAWGQIDGGNLHPVGIATSSSFNSVFPMTSGNIGDTIVISWGWSRNHPKEFKYMFRQDFFVPDADDQGLPVYPPRSDAPGYYDTRPASTNYIRVDDNGFSREDGLAFANGDAARFTGDNWNDPSTEIPADSDFKYIAEAVNMAAVATPGYQSVLPRIYKKGFITSGDTWGFKDDNANVGGGWWDDPNGSVIHEGTGATGGSTSSMKENSQWIAASGIYNPFWTSMSNQRFVDMVLEIETNPASGAGIYEARPITVQTVPGGGGAITISVKYPFSTTTVGKRYRIREPGHVPNRWRDRKVKVIKNDGSSVIYPCRWNDDKNIWFETEKTFTFASGWKYEIIQPNPGGVWHRYSNEWHEPKESGIVSQDTRGRPWHRNAAENLPHCYTVPVDDTGGRIRKGDYINCTLLMELYNAINSLVWTANDITWRPDEDNIPDEVTGYEKNTRDLSDLWGGNPSGTNICDDAGSSFDTKWTNNPSDFGDADIYSSNGMPRASAAILMDISEVHSLRFYRRYSYAVISPGCTYHYDDGTPMARKATLWGKAIIYEGDPDEGVLRGYEEGDPLCSGVVVDITSYKYDSNGDFIGGAGFRTWGELVGNNSGATTNSEIIRRVGNLDIDGNTISDWHELSVRPAWDCPEWPGGNPECITGRESSTLRGYVLSVSKAVIKWNVPNGLRFYDTQS